MRTPTQSASGTGLRAGAAVLAAVIAGGLVASGTMPAAAAGTHSGTPSGAAAWPSAHSPLPDGLDPVDDAGVDLQFEGDDGLLDAEGTGTGFRLALPSGAAKDRSYVPERLAVAEGQLRITAAPGAAAGAGDSLENALGFAFARPTSPFATTAEIALPLPSAVGAEAGLWIGADEDNLLTLAVGRSNRGAPEVRLELEDGGEAPTASPSSDQLGEDSRDAPIHLALDIDPKTMTATGSYRVGDGKPTELPAIELPDTFLGSVADAPGAAYLAGVYASGDARGGAAGGEGATAPEAGDPAVYSFDAFTWTADPTGGGAPSEEGPAAEDPAEENPAEETPAGAAPSEGAPESASPGAESPENGAPETEAPENEAPGTGAPATEEPADDSPTAGEPAPEDSAGEPAAEEPATQDTDPAKPAPASPNTKPNAAPVCRPGEWLATYYSGIGLLGAPVKQDCQVDIVHDYPVGEGPEGVGPTSYSVRWSKTIHTKAGAHAFAASADDGIRVLVDGAPVIDRWGAPTQASVEATVDLKAGPHDVVVEYFQAGGTARAGVSYEHAGGDAEAPVAPTNLFAQAHPAETAGSGTAGANKAAEDKAGNVELRWDASASKDTANHRVFRGPDGSSADELEPLSGLLGAVDSSYTDQGADPGTAYVYAVVAVDADGNISDFSNTAEVDALAVEATAAVDAPTQLVATGANTAVALSWGAPSGSVAGYRIHRSLQPTVLDTGELLTGEGLVTGTTFVDQTVTNGTTYFYVVTAVDLFGEETGPSNEVWSVPNIPNTVNVKVDFTTSTGAVPAGYVADWGEAFGPRTGPGQGADNVYGWLTQDGNPLSLAGNGRDRGRAGIDQRLDSIIHAQYGDATGTSGVKTEGIWELAVPNGVYEVTVAVGDNSYDSLHAVNVEAAAGIESFRGTAATEYRTTTVTVGVWDGALTISPQGGTNTKLAFIDVVGVDRAPHVDTMRPENRASGHDPLDGVSATIRIPYAGVGVNPTTLPGNVHLYEVATGAEVPSSTGTSGGNDVISTQPDAALKPNTAYRFTVTAGVKDNFGVPFVPYTSVFTTGAGVQETPEEHTPLVGVGFEKVEQTEANGFYWSSMAFGPDGKMYATSIGQGISRFTVAEDGTLTNREDLGHYGRAIIGLVFDKNATAEDPRLWITSTTANVFNETGEWVSGISLLSGPALETESRVFEGLPRSQADHLTNSIEYGPDGRLYFLQGSNQGAGDLDNSWGQRGEKLLTAAVLVFDPAHSAVQQAIATGVPINVQTSDGGSYDPYAPGAPLQLYATGIRNAYDLVWHSNGHLYVPTNGTAGGANSPGVRANANGTYTRLAASGIPGFSSVNGQDVTEQCVRRGYTGGSVPAVGNQPTQRDLLFDVVAGGYYGHPNPERCEWVLNEGNDPANPPLSAGQGGSRYPAGTLADPDYEGIAWDLEFNKSPNGSIEYGSNAFGGQLQGRLIVTRFSNNNDLLFLEVDPETGDVLGQQTSVGITGVDNSMINGVSGFNDPLEVVEDPRTGNLYVNQYDRSGSDQKMWLLKVPEGQQAAPLESSADELVFSAVKQTTSAGKTVDVTNAGPSAVVLDATLSGANASDFRVVSGNGAVLEPGATAAVAVAFAPGNTVGKRQASLVLATGSGSIAVDLFGLTMNGIEGDNEPVLQSVVDVLGYGVDVGFNVLAGGTDPGARGEEVLEPLFVRASNAPVGMVPLAQYAPRENLPYGWYTGDGATAQRHQVGSIHIDGYQSLLPPTGAGSSAAFDPGDEAFGLYYYSNAFQRLGFTEDRLNTGGVPHRARVYPAKDRAGQPIPNTYLVGFEDASNGDYQDYLFLLTGVRPAGEVVDPGDGEPAGAIKVDFTTAAGALAPNYLRDSGQAFGPRAGADQGGQAFGWLNQAIGNPTDMSTAARERVVAGDYDVRQLSLTHMQSADVPYFTGVSTYAKWELALPDGVYDVTVGVGEPTFQALPGEHSINIEGQPVISRFVPTGAPGNPARSTSATGRVAVSDGRLTIDAVGGTNTKIGFVDVVPVPDAVGDDPTDGAQVKVNFQTSASATPAGWLADSGLPYDAGRGSGWLSGGSPVNLTAYARHRAAATAGINYPLNEPLLQGYLHMGPTAALASATWEHAVPNGTYLVGVSVGDSAYLDSVHGIAAEGQPVIQSFVPTGATPFQTGSRQVTVSDGKLTLTSTGTNTKINWVSIKGAALDEVPATAPVAKYSFQPADFGTIEGWIPDSGGAFDGDGHGWLVGGIPADRQGAVYRASALNGITYPAGNPLLQTTMHMQAGTRAGVVDGVWERALANGTYTVELSVGDANYLNSTHAVSVEGEPTMEPFVPSATQPFKTVAVTVDVSDGRLTLVPTGTNTKVNWITVTGENLDDPVVVPDPDPEPEEPDAEAIRINAGGPAVVVAGTQWQADTFGTGGKSFTNPAVTAIAGTDADALYLDERSGASFAYAIPVPAGTYRVRLHFAEIWHGSLAWAPGGAGKRVFSVDIESGKAAVSGLDIGAVAGTAAARVESRDVVVEDGELNLAFGSTIDEASVGAIEVVRVGPPT